MIVHCDDRPDGEIATKEYMFPFASVVQCPQAEMLAKIGPTLVGTVITEDRQCDPCGQRRQYTSIA